MLILSRSPDHKLASGFDLKDGYVKFNCPKVEAGSNYIVVCKCLARIVDLIRRDSFLRSVFGDSGNRSPKFSILH